MKVWAMAFVIPTALASRTNRTAVTALFSCKSFVRIIFLIDDFDSIFIQKYGKKQDELSSLRKKQFAMRKKNG